MNANDIDHDDDIATALRDAAQAFTPSEAFARSVDGRFAALASDSTRAGRPSARSPLRLRAMPWSIASALAALLTIAAVISSLALWPATPTLADVQAAVNAAPWVHLTLENGKQWWNSPTLELSALDASKVEGYLSFIDYSTGTRSSFHIGQSVIRQDSVDAPPLPKTAWEIVVGSTERLASGANTMRDVQAEQHTEVIDGRELLRFDSFLIDALNEKLLLRQLWADPSTRLPVRVRERLQNHERKVGGPEFVEGIYEFPARGPMNIFELGAPRDAPIVKLQRFDERQMDARVIELLTSIDRAEATFLDAFQLVTWEVEGYGSSVGMLQWVGHASLMRINDKVSTMDYSRCRIRQENFASRIEANGVKPDQSSTAEQVFGWCRDSVAENTGLYDGELSYMQRGPLPPDYEDAAEEGIKIDVHRDGRQGPLFNKGYWPSQLFWPLARFSGSYGETTFIDRPVDAPPGAIAIRISQNDNQYTEYVFDPAHDFICVRMTISIKRDGQSTTKREETLSEFVQLPTGQWVPTLQRVYQAGDPDRGVDSSTSVRRIAIVPMTERDFPPGTFDGALLLEKAKAQGATVRTY